MLSQALQQNKTYEDEINQADNTALSQAPSEVRDKMNQFRMNEEFADEASALRFPQFMLETGPSLFSEAHETLELEHLEGGFSLRDKDAHVDFTTVNAEMARVDVDLSLIHIWRWANFCACFCSAAAGQSIRRTLGLGWRFSYWSAKTNCPKPLYLV